MLSKNSSRLLTIKGLLPKNFFSLKVEARKEEGKKKMPNDNRPLEKGSFTWDFR